MYRGPGGRGVSGGGNTSGVATAVRGSAVEANAEVARSDVKPSRRRRLISILLVGDRVLDILAGWSSRIVLLREGIADGSYTASNGRCHAGMRSVALRCRENRVQAALG